MSSVQHEGKDGKTTTFFYEIEDRGYVLKGKSDKKDEIIPALEGLEVSKATLFPEINEVAQHIKSYTAEYLKD
ncbi:hypothetical protein [Candidatus Enterovibrio escicola]|uniref:Uncharacterized protein n=1 Tax=Candidatus Enterovibrio escicola TaxID=1927127 RepID=A0A2A5T3G4_9GAMM|nr:hypothetical protein [Candidatus Enterovibrio escacola]PCS22694.1 hypothetical protein BTN49_1652 [Candidatus Enterovibrio escacola]